MSIRGLSIKFNPTKRYCNLAENGLIFFVFFVFFLLKSDQRWCLPGMCTILQLQFSTMYRVSQSILQAVTL